jgi:hypothetical protein
MHRRKNYYFRAVGFIEEDGRWGAICLETSYIGYGATFEAALADLVAATRCAIASIRAAGLTDAAMGQPASRRDWALYERAIANARHPSATFQVQVTPRRRAA